MKRHCWGERIFTPERLLDRLGRDLPRYHAVQSLVMCRHCGLLKLESANQIRTFYSTRFYRPGGPRGFTLISESKTPPCDRSGLPANDLPRQRFIWPDGWRGV